MNDNEMDELLSFVVSDLETSVPESFNEAVSNVRAPLSLLIEEFLERQPGVKLRECLAAIANLNQGRLQDLEVPLFRSYIISKTGIGEPVLNKCIDEINSFWRLRSLLNDKEPRFLMAARDEDGSGGNPISAADLLRQLGKRSE